MPAISRMQFLRGDFRGQPAPIRPPWAWAEAQFTDQCRRCEACRTACPSGILVAGRGGFPQVDFSRGECTFCAACVDACRDGAFDLAARSLGSGAAWPQRAHIGQTCLTQQNVVCRTCGEFCEARAIAFRPALGGVSRPALDLDSCNGCGACVAVCPSSAITMTIPEAPDGQPLAPRGSSQSAESPRGTSLVTASVESV